MSSHALAQLLDDGGGGGVACSCSAVLVAGTAVEPTGVPVAPSGTIALLPENIEKFTKDLDRPASEGGADSLLAALADLLDHLRVTVLQRRELLLHLGVGVAPRLTSEDGVDGDEDPPRPTASRGRRGGVLVRPFLTHRWPPRAAAAARP